MATESLNVSELRHRIVIYDRISGKDDAGFDANEKNELIHICWAKFTRVSGAQTIRDGADFSTVRARLVIRATKKLSDWMQRNLHIRYKGHDYEVKYINEYQDKLAFTEIVCELVEAGGADSADA